MNTLSWLIYFANISAGFMAAFAIFGTVFVIGGTIMFLVCTGIQTDTPDEKFAQVFRPLSRRFALSGAVMIALAVFMPGKDALYMIAASEMGERVVSQPETKEMLGDLREVIGKQIKKLKDDK